MKCFVALTCLLALSVPSRAYGSSGLVYAPSYSSADYYQYPSYGYDYTVRDPHTGDNKGQWERRDGDLVIGGYSLVEPGGSIRVVEYRADKSGFQTTVLKRIGPKVHPGGAVSQINIERPGRPILRAVAPIAPAPIVVPAPAPIPVPLPVPIKPIAEPVYLRAPLPAPIPLPILTPNYLPLPRIPIGHGLGHGPIYNPYPLGYH